MFLNADSEDGGADEELVYIRKSDMRRAGRLMRRLAFAVRRIEAKGLGDTFIRFEAGELGEDGALAEISEKIKGKHEDEGICEESQMELAFFSAAADLDNKLSRLIRLPGEGESGQKRGLLCFKRCELTDKLLEAGRNEVLDFEKITLKVYGDMCRGYGESYEIKKTAGGAEIEYSYDGNSGSNLRRVIKTCLNGDKQLYKAVAHLLAVCEADTWSQKEWDSYERGRIVLHDESRKIYISFGGNKDLSLSGRGSYAGLFFECLKAIMLTPHFQADRFLASDESYLYIERILANYRKLPSTVSDYWYRLFFD